MIPALPPGIDANLLSRVEDAGLNASAPPQQRWVDGWLLRFCPGQARRSRCIQPVAAGRLGNAQRLALCEAVFAEAGLPLLVRITPFSQPSGLGQWLHGLGLQRLDESRVMVSTALPSAAPPLPPGTRLEAVDAARYAEVVGGMRGSTAAQRLGHAQRLALSPVPYHGWLLRRVDDGQILACAQTAVEADMVGLYDVFTASQARGQGLAGVLCATLLAQTATGGARLAYLQVGADNGSAIRVYRRLGFVDAYSYHYLARDPQAA